MYGHKIKRSQKLAQYKREVLIVKIGFFVLLFLLILSLLIYLSRISRFHLNKIIIEGNSVTLESEIKETILRNTAGYYFKMFPRKNIFIYPKSRIKEDLMEEFKRIKSVELSIEDTEELHITIKEREPDTLWCGLKKVDKSDCYFVDKDGYVYSKAPNFSGDVFFKVYGEVNGGGPIGGQFLQQSKYQSLLFFKSAIEEALLKPVAVFKSIDGDMEIYLDDDSRIIYNLEQDINRLATDLALILKNDSFLKEMAEKGTPLDYVDLRFGNKVYYKFK